METTATIAAKTLKEKFEYQMKKTQKKLNSAFLQKKLRQ
jgi:hypothetical protein